MLNKIYLIFLSVLFLITIACNTKTSHIEATGRETTKNQTQKQDSLKAESTIASSTKSTGVSDSKTALSTVCIYNFHITNRCPSCIAIEDGTTKVLNQYFSKELKSSRIKRQIINVDDDANKTISEKYQAFGSGLLLVKSLNGIETKIDLTGDGFKYAKNKEEKFIEIP